MSSVLVSFSPTNKINFTCRKDDENSEFRHTYRMIGTFFTVFLSHYDKESSEFGHMSMIGTFLTVLSHLVRMKTVLSVSI